LRQVHYLSIYQVVRKLSPQDFGGLFGYVTPHFRIRLYTARGIVAGEDDIFKSE
jgi:hypothetical protein